MDFLDVLDQGLIPELPSDEDPGSGRTQLPRKPQQAVVFKLGARVSHRLTATARKSLAECSQIHSSVGHSVICGLVISIP